MLACECGLSLQVVQDLKHGQGSSSEKVASLLNVSSEAARQALPPEPGGRSPAAGGSGIRSVRVQQSSCGGRKAVAAPPAPPAFRRFQEIVWATFFAASFGVRCSAPLSDFCFLAAQALPKNRVSRASSWANDTSAQKPFHDTEYECGGSTTRHSWAEPPHGKNG